MFLKNKNIIFKIRRSKVTDYAALKAALSTEIMLYMLCGAVAKKLQNNSPGKL